MCASEWELKHIRLQEIEPVIECDTQDVRQGPENEGGSTCPRPVLFRSHHDSERQRRQCCPAWHGLPCPVVGNYPYRCPFFADKTN